MSDPRAYLTSASNALADKLCPGRHLAQRGLPEPPRRDAEAGELVHLAFKTGEGYESLSPHMLKTLTRAREIEGMVAGQWLVSGGVMQRAHREIRLWARKRGEAIHSGQIDALWLKDEMKHALVEDLKSLFGDVEDVEINEQLRDYAALVYENYGVESVTVFVNQPNIRWNPQDQKLVTYHEDDLRRAHKEMLARVKASNHVQARRVPGYEQCKFCRACGTDRCPESQEMAFAAGDVKPKGVEFMDRIQRGKFIEQIKTSEKIIENALTDIKRRLTADPNFAAGWGVSDSKDVRSIEDVIGAGSVLKEAFGEDVPSAELADRLAKCCNLKIGELERLHEKLSGLTGKEAKSQFDMLFGHLVRRKSRAGSLVKVKESEPEPIEDEDEIPF